MYKIVLYCVWCAVLIMHDALCAVQCKSYPICCVVCNVNHTWCVVWCAARLCGSYRLWVWLVLGLGSSLSFISLSSQAAVFTCRRLASAHLAASDETQPTASWDKTQPTASWDETQPTASWTGTQINASLDEMRRDDSWDGRYTQVALSQTGTTYDETLVSHETEKTQSLGVASVGEGGLEGTRGPPASVRNDSTTTVNGTAAVCATMTACVCVCVCVCVLSLIHISEPTRPP